MSGFESFERAEILDAMNRGFKSEDPGVSIQGDAAVVTSVVMRDKPLDDIPGTLRARGIEPDDWIVDHCVVNTWTTTAFLHGQPIQTDNFQLKIWLKAKPNPILFVGARIDGPVYLAGFQVPTKSPADPKLVAFISDQQGSYHDPVLHELTCEWLAANHPDILICGGDGVDFPALTRHTRNPDHDVPVQQCLDAAYRLYRDYVEAAGANCTKRVVIEGNHEYHLKRAIVSELPQIYGLSRAEENLSVLSIPYLLRLDELGFSYVGDYPHGAFSLPGYKFLWRHGWLVNGKSGGSALKTVEKLGCSTCVGHTHRRGVTYLTMPMVDLEGRELIAQEAGTMTTIKGGLGYEPGPNWQNGFATNWLYPDGTVTADNAIYTGGSLFWQGQCYTKTKAKRKR